jgi:hypothetical protein
MAESAEELLKAMAAEKKNQANASSPIAEDYFYSKILVNKNKRTSLFVGVTFFFVLFTFILFANINLSQSWTLIVGPIMLCAAAIVLIPISEEWVYKPWQVNPQKYERHFTE